LKDFTTQKSIIPFISNALAMELAAPIKFIRSGRGGILASGFEAHMLPDLCDAILEVRNNGALSGSRQLAITKQCEVKRIGAPIMQKWLHWALCQPLTHWCKK